MALRGCRTARSQIGEGAREAWLVVMWGDGDLGLIENAEKGGGSPYDQWQDF